MHIDIHIHACIQMRTLDVPSEKGSPSPTPSTPPTNLSVGGKGGGGSSSYSSAGSPRLCSKGGQGVAGGKRIRDQVYLFGGDDGIHIQAHFESHQMDITFILQKILLLCL